MRLYRPKAPEYRPETLWPAAGVYIIVRVGKEAARCPAEFVVMAR